MSFHQSRSQVLRVFLRSLAAAFLLLTASSIARLFSSAFPWFSVLTLISWSLASCTFASRASLSCSLPTSHGRACGFCFSPRTSSPTSLLISHISSHSSSLSSLSGTFSSIFLSYSSLCLFASVVGPSILDQSGTPLASAPSAGPSCHFILHLSSTSTGSWSVYAPHAMIPSSLVIFSGLIVLSLLVSPPRSSPPLVPQCSARQALKDHRSSFFISTWSSSCEVPYLK